MSRTDELRAELELAELEDKLADAKADPKTKGDKLADLKNHVRAARQAYREAREG
jgi:chromosome segregation ATPase